MNPQADLGGVLTRIAMATSVIRARKQDAIRREVNGGHNGELIARIEKTVSDLRATAAKLERAIT